MRLIQKLRGFDSYIIELTVIITGILLALAADASWDYRQDRKQERDVIKALVIEFQHVLLCYGKMVAMGTTE